MGIAFQIADDLLDILGSENQTGKSLGSDIEKQKLKLPLIRLLSQSGEPETTRIRELLTHLGRKTRAALAPYLERSDAVSYAQQRADEFASAARRQLQCLDDSPAKQILEAITEFAIHRSY